MSKSLKSYSISELQTLLQNYNQPCYRARQLAIWLYQKQVESFDAMSNLPLSLRSLLAHEHPFTIPRIIKKQTSLDGTTKYLLGFEDAVTIETVAIPDNKRLTVCCSTQAGCAMACEFCATGKGGFIRNLTPGEICDQISLVEKCFNQRVSNVVYMGQGEPFLNFNNLTASLDILNSKYLYNIGARHITISTCGIIPGIEMFSHLSQQYTLALSLHSAIQEKRDFLMPGVKSYPLLPLKSCLKNYCSLTKRRLTIEYALINKCNDLPEDLEALISFCKGILCHINLIPLNHIKESSLKPSSASLCRHWQLSLNKKGIETTVRNSRGSDIAGACGQLKASIHQ